MATFGHKTGSIKNLKQSLAKGGGSAWIKYIPKNGSMNVRFIQEPEEWVNYVEHYDAMMKKSFPCNGESSCPGCTSGERKSSRYLANAVDRDNKDTVIPLQLPKDLANRLVVRYERNGTLTDRDFELSRSGEGLDTVYDLDAGIVDKANIAKFAPIDLLKTLEEAYNSVFGQGSDDEGFEEVKPKTRAKSKAAAVVDDEDDEEEDETPAPKARAKKKAPEPVFEVDDDDDEDEEVEDEPEEDEDDEEVEYDEDTLRALPLGALRSVAREFGIDPKGKGSDAIIEAIMELAEDDDEDA